MGAHEAGTQNTLFLNVSKGKLVAGSVAKGTHKEYYAFTGNLLKIEPFQDEYEGKPIFKVRLHMQDMSEANKTTITFTEESWFSVGFYARLYNVDLSKPFTVGAMQSEQNEKVSFCWLKQGEKKIEKHPDAVSPTKTVNKRKADLVEYNYDLFLSFAAGVNAWANAEIEKFKTHDPELSQAASKTVETKVDTKLDDDDLPF